MNTHQNKFATLVASSLVISLLAVAGCGKADMSTAAPPSAATIPPAPAPYTPPTAEQLEQMVAAIALFPDKLLAQVLAGSTYPEQITAAHLWLEQNPSLKGEALQNAANLQPWDVSVKSLTAFPAVLAQMANNIQWTTALGEAYANDPNDVMNAIQSMRLRAQQSGNLKTSPKMKVTSSPRLAPPPDYADESDYSVIPPPSETIVIESAQPDIVYVPDYNPAFVYGAPIPVYPNYAYNSGNMITTGIISFGIGILVGSAIHHHNEWGWHSWGMNWGGHGSGSGSSPGYGTNHGWHRPAVVYNNATYAPRSSIIINRNNNSLHISSTSSASHNNAPDGNNNTNRPRVSSGTPNFRPQSQNLSTQTQSGPMTMPHFNSGDVHPNARPAMNGPGPQRHANIPHSTPARETQRPEMREMPHHTNNRGPETRLQSETGQSLNSNRLQHRTGQGTLNTEGPQQNSMSARPSPNTLRSTRGPQNEMHQQDIERENMPLRSNPEPMRARPQTSQQQAHPQIYSAPAPQQPRFEQPQQPRVHAPRFEQPQARPQVQEPRTQRREQERSHRAKEEDRRER